MRRVDRPRRSTVKAARDFGRAPTGKQAQSRMELRSVDCGTQDMLCLRPLRTREQRYHRAVVVTSLSPRIAVAPGSLEKRGRSGGWAKGTERRITRYAPFTSPLLAVSPIASPITGMALASSHNHVWVIDGATE